jgi:hypothetical protein
MDVERGLLWFFRLLSNNLLYLKGLEMFSICSQDAFLEATIGDIDSYREGSGWM